MPHKNIENIHDLREKAIKKKVASTENIDVLVDCLGKSFTHLQTGSHEKIITIVAKRFHKIHSKGHLHTYLANVMKFASIEDDQKGFQAPCQIIPDFFPNLISLLSDFRDYMEMLEVIEHSRAYAKSTSYQADSYTFHIAKHISNVRMAEDQAKRAIDWLEAKTKDCGERMRIIQSLYKIIVPQERNQDVLFELSFKQGVQPQEQTDALKRYLG